VVRRFFRRSAGTTGWGPAGAVPVPLAIAGISLAVTVILLGLRQLGGLQSLELAAYDQMIRLRPAAPPDLRLLIVAITEADIAQQKQWPLSDQTLANALHILQQQQPAAIGLDIWRDIPHAPGHAALTQQLRQPNVIAIQKIQDADAPGVPAPPNMPPERVGFNDFVIDPDGVIRRNLLFADVDAQTTMFSLSLRLVLAYLEPQGVQPRLNEAGNLVLKTTEFRPLHAAFGAYERIDAAGYQMLLHYRQARQPARQVTLGAVLAGQVPPEWVRGKIVLIGATARSAKDDFLSPYSRGIGAKMPGVVIHAQAVSEILSATLDRQPLWGDWAEGLEMLWLGAWAIAGGSIAWSIRRPLLLAGAMGVGLALIIAIGYGYFLNRIWIPVVAPGLGLVMSAGAVVSYRAQQAQRQQQMMMKLLGQNASPEIAATLWNSRDRLLKSGKLPGKRLIATMVFTDIKDFSNVAEHMPPEGLLEWLNEYLSGMTEEVLAHHGIINKFTGDGLLAAFGVPVDHSASTEMRQDAQRAVACALAFGDRLKHLNQDWQDRGLPTIQMRVGIFTGAVVVGSLGGRDRLEYGIIGDSVNVASRLESYEKTRHDPGDICRVLIGRDTLNCLEDKFTVEDWGPLALKGKQEKVDVYRVLGRTGGDAQIGSGPD
jgi:adenylate cyclase